MNKNMNIIAATLPDANSDNKIEEWTGIGWNFVTRLTGGILPSNANNGGLLAQVPVLTGTPDSQQRTAQIVNHLSEAYEDNKNLYIEFEKSDSYKSLSSKDKEKYKNKGLYISKKPITITKETASGQNSVNGILNSMSDAIKGGLHLTGQTDFNKPITLNVIYNPTNGFFSDILEAGVDKFGGTTGTAKQGGKKWSVKN